MSNKRIIYISLLQIIGPIFVVLGHSLNGLASKGAWYIFSKEWIYIFHMPLFFMISGYLLAYKGYLRKWSYGKFILEKVKRLLVPWFFWNSLVWMIIIVYKFVISKSSFNWSDMLIGFIEPRANALTVTWFLFALFVVYLAAPLFQGILNFKNPIGIAITLTICITLYILPLNTELFALSDLHKDLLFFVVGCLLGQMEADKFETLMKRSRIWLIAGAVTFSAVSLVWYEQTKMFHFIPCAFILLSFLSVFVSIKELSLFLTTIASYSFGIYIMHWPVMMVARALMQRLGAGTVLTATIMIILGYFVPVLALFVIRTLPFKKIKVPLKYLLGA